MIIIGAGDEDAEERTGTEAGNRDAVCGYAGAEGSSAAKIDAAVDFTHVYELVEDLYCEDNGRPSCDPVVLFKLVLIQHLFGIRSLRQTMKDAEVNVAYRWFWDIPCHSRFRILRRSAMRFATALLRK